MALPTHNRSSPYDPTKDVPEVTSEAPPAYTPRRTGMTATPSLVGYVGGMREAFAGADRNTPDVAGTTDNTAGFVPQARISSVGMTAAQIADFTGTAAAADSDSAYDSAHSLYEGAPTPIVLRISTTVRVSNNNNLVALTRTPAESASAVAHEVVRAMREGSAARCGLPMIDEDGRPRPINIEVDAGIDVRGSGNVVGPRELVEEALRLRAERMRRRDREVREDGGDERQPNRNGDVES